MSAIAGKAAIDGTAAIIAWLGALAAGAGGNIDMSSAKKSLSDPKVQEALGLTGRGAVGGILPPAGASRFGLEPIRMPKDGKKEEKKDDKKDDGPRIPPTDPRRPPEKDKDKPKPPRFPDQKEPKKEPTEIPISGSAGKPPAGNGITNQAHPQWYSEFKFGGQDILKLTDIQKLEELRNWTLFDLVNPILRGDPDNLLAIQNDIYERRRFNNTYPNPRPPPDYNNAPYPAYIKTYADPLKSALPVPYPFRESTVREQYYYDRFNDQDPSTSNYLKDLENRGLDVEFTQIANAKRREYSAEDAKIRKGNAKMSIIEGYDVSKLSDVDYMLNK